MKEKSKEALSRLMRSLLIYSQENVEELQMLQIEEKEVMSPNEQSSEGKCHGAHIIPV